MSGTTQVTLGVVVLVLVIAAGYGVTLIAYQPPSGIPVGVTVEIRDQTFPAASVTGVGTTVTWINMDSVQHTVTGEGWGSGTLRPGESWSYTFTQPGTYFYKCTIHPEMTGLVMVE